VVPFQNCVRQHRPVSKIAAITENRNFFKWPKLLYFKPESACRPFVYISFQPDLGFLVLFLVTF
jgi:hypothetical protein